jgi:hypothetical protein
MDEQGEMSTIRHDAGQRSTFWPVLTDGSTGSKAFTNSVIKARS